ncbi:YybH family protein [Pseudomonas syringae]|uniref:YybH family protein n=1 Tax=Pseudomonas syringae TaxID=317 RepID=UPI003F74EC4C
MKSLDRLIGHAAIREALSGWIKAVNLEWVEGPTALLNASKDIAVLTGAWVATFKGEDGELTVTKGRNVEVVRLQSDGTWRFIIDDANGAT